jgi:hypothetical protein
MHLCDSLCGYAMAAQQQHAAACSNLGAMLEHGLGLQQDLQEALSMCAQTPPSVRFVTSWQGTI